jgi:hypothetical protein
MSTSNAAALTIKQRAAVILEAVDAIDQSFTMVDRIKAIPGGI